MSSLFGSVPDLNRPHCGYGACSPNRLADRVIRYPLFLFICNTCFMEYQKHHDQIDWISISEYERSLQ